VEEQLEEPNGVALVLKELRQGPLYHRVGADDGYRGCGLVLSHLLAVAPLAYEKRAEAPLVVVVCFTSVSANELIQ
jgi:hypothetical protein